MKNRYVHDAVVHNTRAAERIVPFLMDSLSISNVIDVGCGTGTWLKVFYDKGIEIYGVEGFHLNRSKLLIPEDKVFLHDLEIPFKMDRRFDLAISLEVAEHLDERVSKQFIGDLVNLSDVIFFSAAVPYQGGQNHINEQWHSYWINIFQEHNYVLCDIIRPLFWNDTQVEAWYKQNAFLFVKDSWGGRERLAGFKSFHGMNIVHPELFLKKSLILYKLQNGPYGIANALKVLIKLFLNVLKRR